MRFPVNLISEGSFMFTVKDAEQKRFFSLKTLIMIVIMISGSWDGDIVSVEGDMRGS